MGSGGVCYNNVCNEMPPNLTRLAKLRPQYLPGRYLTKILLNITGEE